MIEPKRLLEDLKRFVKRLEDDLRERASSVSEMADRLKAEYQSAKEAGRTGESFEAWREGVLTQASVAWILGCVFVRFMEDNDLVNDPLISGPGEKRARASDRQTLYFQSHPMDTDRDYLYDVFRTVAGLPAVAKLYEGGRGQGAGDRKETQNLSSSETCTLPPATCNLFWTYGISGDTAKELIAFWRQVVPETGELVHDFTDADWDTRFLGDLYQDLSEVARKRFALLQTPEFVEEFILDRTLDPAIEEFGLKEARLIDPTCGSGHFLLGAFLRLLEQWFRKEPGTPERELVQRALDGVYGVDINPYATAIARFRLLIEALKASGIRKIKEAPGYRINVTAGDSLLHGPRLLTAADSIARHGARSGELDLGSGADQLRLRPGVGHAFEAEDLGELNRILGQGYHAVVGNPPYITVKDKALNKLYRDRYQTCHRQYALAVPFTERFFQLAVPASSNGEGAGYVGMITANSFMKREFGKKLVEAFFPGVDLTHVIDTSGAYIPGHGTPTVILFGRERLPVASTVRTIMGIKGEPVTPVDASKGAVWSAIVKQVDEVGSESEWVSVADTPREGFARHPWSVGGGGAADLKESLETVCQKELGELTDLIGFVCMTRADDVYFTPRKSLLRAGISDGFVVDNVEGDRVRDWDVSEPNQTLFPYDSRLEPVGPVEGLYVHRFLWPYRSILWFRREPNGNHIELGLTWWEWSRFLRDRYRTPLSIAFAFVATHNHFVLDRGGKVFNRSAPVIKLPTGATEGDHLALLGLLNSTTACFWMKQVFHNKGSTVDTKGARQTTDAFENFYEFTGTGLKKFPIPDAKPLDLSTELDRLARERQAHLPAQLGGTLPLARGDLDTHQVEAEALLRRMIAVQEELDWLCYQLYGLVKPDAHLTLPPDACPLPPLALGERAFEIAMARQMAKGELETTWFERHRSKPITEVPSQWPEDYRQLVERRIALIESDRYIGLIERPEYKRRWNQEPWEEQEKRALRGWLLDRLEQGRYWPEARLRSTRSLASRAETDTEFMQVAELYVGHPGFDVAALVAELVASESVPFLRVLRYKPSGLRKREIWEKTWQLQRQGDVEKGAGDRVQGAGEESGLPAPCPLPPAPSADEIGEIPPPPKYRAADFLKPSLSRLRGPLDVPKERFVSYLHCSRENDSSLVVGWAGWDHLQQAQALAGYYTEMVEQEGWQAERLRPLLAGLGELMPWLKQWHKRHRPHFQRAHGGFL